MELTNLYSLLIPTQMTFGIGNISDPTMVVS
jgi:hypothetical protein